MTARGTGATAWLSAATVVATVATAGSLWFSLGLGLTPCDLCWYQRIAMYPLTVVLGGPCAAVLWESPVFGLTIPNLSLVAFALLGGLLVGARRRA
ncbi:disulfide bond formation protein B [Halorubrum sp. 2020YC2]|uniref:disulfide bond formation protein B n=1 Tax=Halorubrum sp. 2020YC2 TaxID=2836432 RepID=UPI001BEBA529|nr:disulfide bond formation protein B [Halorubrum sp. 2020YC2]QWC19763.1 disulfide bond formation protein B [Halorubrum sp. 2020YC2]